MPYIRSKSLVGRCRTVYSRLSFPEWTRPGGIVWVGLAIWLLILLGLYSIYTGFVAGSDRGIEYSLPHHRLRDGDIQRILGRQPVRDARGIVVIDPDEDHIAIVAIDSSGQSALQFTSRPSRPNGRRLIVLVPDRTASYQDVIAAIDAVANEETTGRPLIWISSPM